MTLPVTPTGSHLQPPCPQEAIIASEGLRPWVPSARDLAVSFYDLGLNARVCRDGHMQNFQQQAAWTPPTEEMYIDLVKRSVSYFLFGDVPHELMPRVEWDIFYRMR